MGTPVVNKLITIGLGPSNGTPGRAGIVTLGYGGPPTFVVTEIEEAVRPLRLRLGQSGTKRRLEQLDEVIVWAKLIDVNGRAPKTEIKGSIRVPVTKGRASVFVEGVSVRVRAAWETIRVTVSRLK